MRVSQPIVWSGGVNQYADPRAIRDDQLVRCRDFFPTRSGILSRRPGVSFNRSAIFGSLLRFFPLDFGLADPSSGYQYVAHLHQWDANPPTPSHLLVASNFNREDNSFPNSVKVSLGNWQSAYEPVQFLNYRGRTLAIVPTMEGFYQFSPPDSQPNTWTWKRMTFAAKYDSGGVLWIQTIPVQPKLAVSYRDRLHFALNDPSMGHWLVVADRATARTDSIVNAPPWINLGNDVLLYNGRHLELNQIAGEHISAMAEISLSSMGSQIDTVLMVLTTEGSCLFCTGEIAQTEETGATGALTYIGTFKTQKVNYKVGGVSQKTLVRTPYGFIWPSTDDVWILSDNTPNRIGTSIRPVLASCPANERKYWSAAYADGIYILQLIRNVTTTEAGAVAGNTSTYIAEQWWLDLRSGAPRSAEEARWYGPMVMGLDDGASFITGPVISVPGQSDTQERIQSLVFNLGTSLANSTCLIDHALTEAPAYDQVIQQVVTGPEWTALTAYTVGDLVRPQHFTNNGRIYVCTVAGTTAASEPTWPTTGNVVDGTVTWTEIISAPQYGTPISILGTSAYNIAGELRTKDFTADKPIQEKVFMGLAVSAKCGQKSQGLTGTVYKNGGASSLGVGAADIIGGSAGAQLGIDTSKPLSDIFEARFLREAPDTTIKGNSLQIVLTGQNNYVIDSTNDYIVWGCLNFLTVTGDSNLRQAQLTHGNYNMLDLLTHVVALMNANQGASPFGQGADTYTHNANPWSLSSPFSGGAPYNTKVDFAFTARNGTAAIAFHHGPTNVALFGGITWQLAKSKALLAMLGYDTVPYYAQINGIDVNAAIHTIFEPNQLWTSGSPHSIHGIVPPSYYNNQSLQINEATLFMGVHPGLPLTGQNP